MTAAKEAPARVHWKARAAAIAILAIMRALGSTYRITVSGHRAALLDLARGNDPAILALWHNRLFAFAPLVLADLLPQGFKLAVLTSNSRDGAIGAEVARRSGALVVRGSSNRNGSAGLRSLYRAVSKQRHSIVILPDGSQGPVYKAKAGAVALASMAGVPILPISAWADRAWRLKSWDRMIIPKPFAKIDIVVGEPLQVPRLVGESDFEPSRAALESALDGLGFEAEKTFGRGPLAAG